MRAEHGDGSGTGAFSRVFVSAAEHGHRGRGSRGAVEGQRLERKGSTLTSRLMHRAVLLAALLPVLLGARGDRSFDGHELRERSPKKAEAAVLRSEAEGWRSYEARDGLWILLAENRQDWDARVAPGIARALGRGGSQAEFQRFAGSLDRSIDVQGPDLEGALVRVDLPDDRGRAYASVHLPQLIQSGGDGSLLNTRRPNVGLFLSGADIKRRDDDGVESFYIASRPKDLARGAVPSVEARELPGEGRGDLALFAGRGGSGDDGEDLRNELRRWVGSDELAAGAMRAFPRKGTLNDVLKSIRVEVEHPEPEEGWYRTLSWAPEEWSWATASQRTPTRYLAQAIPVVIDDGGRRREVIVGVVAFYARLFLTPLEAAAHSGDGRGFFGAVHRGEVPFFRLGDEVVFYRAHVDRWLAGRARDGGGKARSYKDAVRMSESWADRARSRTIDRAIRRPLPFRMERIPDEELDEIVDRRRRMRSRVYTDDVSEWLGHQGEGLPEGEAPVWVGGKPGGLAELRASFGAASSAPVASYEPREEPRLRTRDRTRDRSDDEREPGELKKAPRPAGMDEEEEVAALDEEEDEDIEDEPDEDAQEEPDEEEAADLDELGGSATYEPVAAVAVQTIEIYDFFVAGACRAGATQTAVVDLLYDGPDEGEIGTLGVEWDFFVGERIVANDVLEFRRESGSMELEFDLECPVTIGKGRLEVLVRDGARDLQAESATRFEVKEASGRTWAKLSKPSGKRCLSGGPDLDSDSDYGVAETQGLSAEQIGSAVRGFQEQTLRCHVGGSHSGQVQLEFTVGCDGLVKKVEVLEDQTSDLSGTFARCVADTMTHAPFPAHARDEVFFTMPLRFE